MDKHCCHTPLNEAEARDLLTGNGMNRTKVKIKLLLEISRSSRPLSVAELHEKVKEGCDISTIFRTVSQFREKDLVREVNLDEGFFRYEMGDGNTHKHQHHHHHVRCRSCGDIRQIEKCDLSIFERAITRLGFTSMEHRLEFSGLCSRCS